MVIQIIEENRRPDPIRKPTMKDRFLNAMDVAVDVGTKTWLSESERKAAKEKQDKENEFARRMFGEDISGLTEPKARQEYFSERFRGQTQEKKAQFDAFTNDKRDKQKFEYQKELLDKKYQNDINKPSKSAGGLTGQSVPPEVSLAANKIIQHFPDASADQLKMMMDEVGIPPVYSNGYVENRRRQDERAAVSKEKRLESGHKRAEKIIDTADKLGEELPLLESSIMAMEDAVVNGDQSFWSPDNIAEMTGIELFRTAKGGQFKTAAKTYFINDLKASGARPNQFLEKQFVDALAKVGRSQEANQTVIESFKFSNDIKRKKLETIRNLQKFYEEGNGYLPSNFNRIVEETMEPYIKDRQKEYEKRLKELHVQEKKKSMKKGKISTSEAMIVQVEGPDGMIYETESDNIEQLPEGFRVL